MGARARTLCILFLCSCVSRRSSFQLPARSYAQNYTLGVVARPGDLTRLEPPSNLHPGIIMIDTLPPAFKRRGLRMCARQAANYPAAFYADPVKRPPRLPLRPDQFRMDIITIARAARLTPHTISPVAIKSLKSRVRLFFLSNNSRNYLCKRAIIMWQPLDHIVGEKIDRDRKREKHVKFYWQRRSNRYSIRFLFLRYKDVMFVYH